jgi:hypothetical protein
MAEADTYQIQRLEQCLGAMPDFDGDQIFQPGDYVVAVLPNGMRRPKLNPQFRGLFLVHRTSGNNESTVHCKNVLDDSITEIHARDLRPIDMSVLASIDEIRGLAAKLLSVPEWVVSEIHDYRVSITGERPEAINDSMLSSLEFLCGIDTMISPTCLCCKRISKLFENLFLSMVRMVEHFACTMFHLSKLSAEVTVFRLRMPRLRRICCWLLKQNDPLERLPLLESRLVVEIAL